jgi:hypothetical protein
MGSGASSIGDTAASVGKWAAKKATSMVGNMADSIINPAITDLSFGILPALNFGGQGADALNSLYHSGGRVHAKLKNGAYVVSHPVHTRGGHVLISKKHALHKHIKKIYK